MVVINEGGTVQAIEHADGYKFFVEDDINDDIFLILIPHLSPEQAENYAKVMSTAWDAAIKYCFEMED